MPRKKVFESQTDYKRQFNAAAYDRLSLTVPKGQKCTIQAAADEAGESVNAYITGAVLARMGLDSWSEKEE